MKKGTDFVIKNKQFIDDKKLLDYYIEEIQKVRKTYSLVYQKMNSFEEYINQIATQTESTASSWISEAKRQIKANQLEADKIEKKIYETDDLEAKKGLIDELKKSVKQLEEIEKENQKFIDAINETVEILKPIFRDLEEVRTQIKKLNFFVLRHRILKALFHIGFIVLISFILNFTLDIVQSFIETNFKINHLHILLTSFLLQTFIIDPYIFSNLKANFNLKLTSKIEIKIPEIESKIQIGKESFNNQVSKFPDLKGFLIE